MAPPTAAKPPPDELAAKNGGVKPSAKAALGTPAPHPTSLRRLRRV